jgi:hypothetical protein
MFYNLRAVSLLELNRLRKSWIFWIGIIVIIGGALFIESPIRDGCLWTSASTAYCFAHAVCMLGAFILPFFMVSLYYYDERTEITKVIFTQPIKAYEYSIGKFSGAFMAYLLIVLIGICIYIFIPLYFKAIPYSPLVFIEAVIIYVIPSMLFYSALCYFVVIIFKSPIMNVLLPIIYLFSEDSIPELFKFTFRGNRLAMLINKDQISEHYLSMIAANRIAVLSIGILLLLLAVTIYSPKKHIERK